MIDIQKKGDPTPAKSSDKIQGKTEKSDDDKTKKISAADKTAESFQDDGDEISLGKKVRGFLAKAGNFFSAWISPKFLVPFFSAIILFAILLILLVYVKPHAAPSCGDGSLYSSCSLDKPFYCSSGILIENASTCGCPSNSTQDNDSCRSYYQNGNVESTNFSYVVEGKQSEINFTMYKGLYDYLFSLPDSITSTDGKVPQRSEFALKRINDPNQEILLAPLVKGIENLAPDSKVDQARIAISLVQNIPWGSSGKTITFGGLKVDYSRYPYQVLYDNQGLCEEKSELLAFILRDLGYGVALFYYPQENHETVGIKCPVSESLNGTGYCFVETSGPAIISDSNLVYANGEKLNSSPEIMNLSDGISLPEGLPEYRDAKKLETLTDRGLLGPIYSMTLNSLEKKYGLGKVYNIN